ncbi:LytTR family DNA-binding domain-containing protein [Anaerolentibacter hominis]|uniref:LytR/AlgR family response regulator transcription factor n=1 Tax=Anaerolentibacter hominis TaxID=3079009 RepID=UPI0031B8963F
MYQIAVCDDKQEHLDEICRMTEEILRELGQENRISRFHSSEELKSELGGGTNYDLLLLDILMEPENGMELAKELRQKQVRASIVFISSSQEYILEGYGVEAVRYLLKPLEKEKLKEAIQFDIENYFRGRSLTVRGQSGIRMIPQREIIYLESDLHTVTIHVKNGEAIYVSGKLSDYAGQLSPRRFARCHQSYCINMEEILQFRRNEILLTDDTKIPVGRKWYQSFRSSFLHLQ